MGRTRHRAADRDIQPPKFRHVRVSQNDLDSVRGAEIGFGPDDAHRYVELDVRWKRLHDNRIDLDTRQIDEASRVVLRPGAGNSPSNAQSQLLRRCLRRTT